MTLVVGAALVAPLVAAGALVVHQAAQSPLQSARSIAPVVAHVERAARTDQVEVPLEVVHAQAFSAMTNASGTVTVLRVAHGTDVAAGAVLGKVDAGDLVAYASAAPLFRDLSRGAKGADVRTAQHVLAAAGLLRGPATGTVDPATVDAIVAFNAEHGWGAKNPVLARAALVWIGRGSVTVGEVGVTLGGVVSAGTVLFSTSAAPVAVTVVEPPGLTQDASWQFTVRGVVVPYQAGSGRVSDGAAVAKIAQAVGDAKQVTGTLALTEPRVVGTVPASAVVADEQGHQCLFPGVTGAPVPVQPSGGDLGTVDLDASLVGASVLVNPRDVRSDLSCG
jgi:peptidoglycan hydrolase-like protein with peptidoglycan-binding domain